MRKITLLTIVALLSFGANAQSLLPTKYGIKVGLNIANVTSTPNEGVKNIETTPLLGVAGGFYMEIALNDKWYINPELHYVQKGASFDYDYNHKWDSISLNNVNSLDEYATTNSLKLAYLELNPTISYKASDKLALNFGPSVSFLISEDYTFTEKIIGDSPPLNSVEPTPGTYESEDLDVGLNLGLSYYITESFLVDAKVNTGFMKVGSVNRITSIEEHDNEKKEYNFELNNRVIVLAFAYLF
ncbi:PorT family protein [Flavobacteriales bacterium]|nr:PorT family protein [Flavobacteriales bacterium]